MASAGTSKSSSTPKDMTPQAFKNLQGPFASVLGNLLGFGQQAAPTPAASASPFAGGSATNTRALSQWQTDHGMDNYVNGQLKPGATSATGPITQPVAGAPVAPGGLTPTGDPNDPLRGIPSYNGPLTANLGANEQSLLDQLMGMSGANGQPRTKTTAETALEQIINGQGASGYSPDGNNPFVQAAIEAAQRPTFQALQETLGRTLPGRFTQAGQFINPQGSSAFDRAAAMASRDATQSAADIGTKISYDSFNSERDRQVQAQEGAANRQLDAAKALPGVSKQEIDTTIANLQAQALPRLIQEMGIERGLQAFQDRMGNLLTTLGIAGGATSPTIANSSKSSSKQMGIGG